VRLKDDSRNPPAGLAAPSDNDFNKAALGAQSLLPLPEDGFEFHWLPGQEVVATNHDLSTDEGWGFVLEDLDDLAEDTANAWSMVWAGLLPAARPGDSLFWSGLARKGNGKHDYSAMTCVSGQPTTFAHELVHTLGYHHAGCPASGAGMPRTIDPDLPMYIEEVAVDTYTNQIFLPGIAGELMSYCSNNGKFTSINLWHKLMDLMKV